MQTIVIAALIIIVGLISAILICAMSLINRARSATTTLRRIEETLLAMNRVRAIDSAVKSAGPVKESQTGVADSNGYLTLRELKTMSGGGRARTNTSPLSTGRKPPRTRAPARATGFQSVPDRDTKPADQPVEVAAQGATDAVLQFVDPAQSTASSPKRNPGLEVTDVTPTQEMFAEPHDEERLEASIEMSWPGLDQQILNLEQEKDTHDAVAHEGLGVASAVAHAAPAANGELAPPKASEASEVAPDAISPARPEMPPEVSTPVVDTHSAFPGATAMESAMGAVPTQSIRADKTAPTGNDLDESRRKKKEQELMMIISSRRRRARAGR